MQMNAMQDAEDAQRESNKISGANEEITNARARRAAAKEARIRRAMIANSSEQSGTAGSSGALGALSAVSSSYGAAVGDQRRNTLAAQGVTRQNQRVSDARTRSERIGIFSGLAMSGLQLGYDEGYIQ